MWIKYGENWTILNDDIEKAIEELLTYKEEFEDAYLEFDGKRIYVRDIDSNQSMEDMIGKTREVTPEEYINSIENVIKLSGGKYPDSRIADDIKNIPDNSKRIPVLLHFIDRLREIEKITDYVAKLATPEERKELLQIYKENGISINKKIFEPRIWIVPNNDLEAKAIIEKLKESREKYIVTEQNWGASWEMLEPEVFEQLKEQGLEIESEYIDILREMDQKVQETNAEISKIYGEIDEFKNKNGVTEESIEIISRKKKIEELESVKSETLEKRQAMASDFLFSINRQANESSTTIYGVELQGNSRGAVDIDHHNERSNEKTSIEQVADILHSELTLDEQFIAANDKGSIQAMEQLTIVLPVPSMEKYGVEVEVTGEDLKEIILNIRRRDRQAQGITMEQEVQAQEAIDRLGDISGKDYVLVDGLPHSKTATIMDRLYAYGIYGKNGNVLITSKDGETNFYGSTEIIEMLDSKFKVEDPNTGRSNCWCGGSLDEGYGFWGGYADQEAIKREVEAAINARRKEQQGHNDSNEKSVDDE